MKTTTGMNNKQLLQFAKETIEKYYSVVDIRKTRGFSSKITNNGYARRGDPSYTPQEEVCGEIQIQIIKNYNEINQRKLSR